MRDAGRDGERAHRVAADRHDGRARALPAGGADRRAAWRDGRDDAGRIDRSLAGL